MSDFEATAASAAPEEGGAVAPAQEPVTDPTAEAASGASPADEFADLEQALADDPRKQAFLERLRGEAEKRRAYEQQISQFQPWQQLQEAGFTPEAVLQALYAQTQGTPETPQQYQPSPEEQFGGWLEAQGVDAWGFGELPVANQVALRQAFQFEQWREQQEQRQQQAELSARHAEVLAQTQQVAQKWPVFQDADFTNLLHANWAAEVQHARSQGRPDPALSETAGRIAAKLEAHVKGELARYSAAKQQDSVVPVAAGGSAPPPVLAKSIHEMSPTERAETIAAWAAAQNSPA